MLFLRRLLVLLLAATGLAQAQPALTTIQDILYRADGTRFSGTMYITWSSFLAGDTSNIATANLTVPSNTYCQFNLLVQLVLGTVRLAVAILEVSPARKLLQVMYMVPLKRVPSAR